MTDRRSRAISAGFFWRRKKSSNVMVGPRMGSRSAEEAREDPATLFLDEPVLALLTEEAVDDVQVGLRDVRGLVEDGRAALVGRQQDRLRLGDHAEQRNAEQLEDVLHAQHL